MKAFIITASVIALVLVVVLVMLSQHKSSTSTSTPTTKYFQCQGTTCSACGAIKTPDCPYTDKTCDNKCSSTPTTTYFRCQGTNCSVCGATKTPDCPYTDKTCDGQCGAKPPPTGKLVGINLAGFDSGNETSVEKAAWSCVSNAQINWAVASGMSIVRMPIIPAYIFNTPPTGTTAYSESLFYKIWTNSSSTNECQSPQPWNNGSYVQALQYALSQGLVVILDAHANTHHLCTFGGQAMTAEVFVNMWQLLSEYIIRNVTGHEKVYFELFNEPVQDSCVNMPTSQWNQDYVVGAIKAIRNVENKLQSQPHWVLATTWGNWSGIHAWVTDGTLPDLVDTLHQNQLDNSVESRVVIAGHQYCDSNYSGIGKDCDPSTFTKDLYSQWIQDTEAVLSKYSLQWMLTEGNVNCGYTSPCTNGLLYVDWLQALMASPSFVGFTVWVSNLGSDYQGADMGAGPGSSGGDQQFKAYSAVYPHTSDGHYSFSTFLK